MMMTVAMPNRSCCRASLRCGRALSVGPESDAVSLSSRSTGVYLKGAIMEVGKRDERIVKEEFRLVVKAQQTPQRRKAVGQACLTTFASRQL